MILHFLFNSSKLFPTSINKGKCHIAHGLYLTLPFFELSMAMEMIFLIIQQQFTVQCSRTFCRPTIFFFLTQLEIFNSQLHPAVKQQVSVTMRNCRIYISYFGSKGSSLQRIACHYKVAILLLAFFCLTDNVLSHSNHTSVSNKIWHWTCGTISHPWILAFSNLLSKFKPHIHSSLKERALFCFFFEVLQPSFLLLSSSVCSGAIISPLSLQFARLNKPSFSSLLFYDRLSIPLLSYQPTSVTVCINLPWTLVDRIVEGRIGLHLID